MTLPVPRFRLLGNGPTVLMLHGLSGGSLAFAPQLETFSVRGFRAVAWDMPGYGHSAPIEPYTFKGLAESAVQLIEALGGHPVAVVGHSMGGMVAQELVARRPDLVTRLVLSGTAPRFGGGSEYWRRKFVDERMAPLEAGESMASLAQSLIPTLVGPRALPEGVRLAQHCMAQVPVAVYRRALEALAAFDRRRELARISCPTLVLAGEQDTVAPAALMHRMAVEIPGATYLSLDGVGHIAPLEQPDDFDAAVLAFLTTPQQLH